MLVLPSPGSASLNCLLGRHFSFQVPACDVLIFGSNFAGQSEPGLEVYSFLKGHSEHRLRTILFRSFYGAWSLLDRLARTSELVLYSLHDIRNKALPWCGARNSDDGDPAIRFSDDSIIGDICCLFRIASFESFFQNVS